MPADKLEGNTLRTRLVMVGVFVGAILALSLSVAFSWGDGVLGGGRVDESPDAKASFHSSAGSCLFWAQADVSDIHLVPCDQPHLYEVTAVVNIADKYPAGVPNTRPCSSTMRCQSRRGVLVPRRTGTSTARMNTPQVSNRQSVRFRARIRRSYRHYHRSCHRHCCSCH